MADVVVLLTGGWGSDDWGETAFGQDTVPDLPSALTANVGSATVLADARTETGGVEGTSAVGFVEATGISTVELSGISASGEVNSLRFDALVSFAGWGRGAWGEGAWSSNTTVPSASASSGSVEIITNVDVAVIGQQGDSAVGSVSVVPGTGVNVTLTGLSATGGVNAVEVIGNSFVSVAGLQGTTAVGEVTQRTTQVVPVSGPPAASAVVGEVAEVIGDANVFVVGLEASLPTPRVLVWGREIPDPGTVWTEIAA